MNLMLSEEQQMLQDMFRDFAANEVAPLAEALDRAESAPLDTLHKAAGLDLLGLVLPEQYGGMNAGWLAYGLLMEELGKACLSTAVAINAHTTAAMLIAGTSSTEQKQRLLPDLAAGRRIAAHALAEPDAGSDLAAIASQACASGGMYTLHGRKSFVINGDSAGVFLIAAKADSGDLAVFAVERNAPGLVVGWRNKQMGLRGASGSNLFLDACRTPLENRLEGDGTALIAQAWPGARLGLAFACLGVAERGLADSLEFAKNRQQFGGPVALKQTIQGYLGDMATQIESLRRLAHHTAWQMEQGKTGERDIAMLKLWAGQVATWVINKTVQIHGGMGYIKSFHVERLYRDVRAMTILEGTSETQRLAVAAELLRPLGVEVKP